MRVEWAALAQLAVLLLAWALEAGAAAWHRCAQDSPLFALARFGGPPSCRRRRRGAVQRVDAETPDGGPLLRALQTRGLGDAALSFLGGADHLALAACGGAGLRLVARHRPHPRAGPEPLARVPAPAVFAALAGLGHAAFAGELARALGAGNAAMAARSAARLAAQGELEAGPPPLAVAIEGGAPAAALCRFPLGRVLARRAPRGAAAALAGPLARLALEAAACAAVLPSARAPTWLRAASVFATCAASAAGGGGGGAGAGDADRGGGDHALAFFLLACARWLGALACASPAGALPRALAAGLAHLAAAALQRARWEAWGFRGHGLPPRVARAAQLGEALRLDQLSYVAAELLGAAPGQFAAAALIALVAAVAAGEGLLVFAPALGGEGEPPHAARVRLTAALALAAFCAAAVTALVAPDGGACAPAAWALRAGAALAVFAAFRAAPPAKRAAAALFERALLAAARRGAARASALRRRLLGPAPA